eukprot:11120376-Heterocapsa_arctica.AAC.1
MRFLETLGFFGYVFSVEIDHVSTPRSRGAALEGLKRKADTRKRAAVPVAFIEYFGTGGEAAHRSGPTAAAEL